ERVVARAKERSLAPAEVHFCYSDRAGGKVSALEPYVGRCGWLSVSRFTVSSLDRAEDHLILVARTDDGTRLEPDAVARLLRIPGSVSGDVTIPEGISAELDQATRRREADIQLDVSERNARFFGAESEKLEGWADDLKQGLERELKDLDRQIKDARKSAATALTLEDKLAAQKQVRAIEATRNEKRRRLFEAQDDVDRRRGELIQEIEAKLGQGTEANLLFRIRWTLSA
ncbi:MAG TPA: hypothetical protein VIP11_14710, partial [Gemmatimonadaceae bacterium]